MYYPEKLIYTVGVFYGDYAAQMTNQLAKNEHEAVEQTRNRLKVLATLWQKIKYLEDEKPKTETLYKVFVDGQLAAITEARNPSEAQEGLKKSLTYHILNIKRQPI